ncbi:hypothetical protein Q7O60_12370 [Pseudomonas protegens]|uniref:hypothetical protein n=1 Tax=Pseudomonas protegens TaxID=380021 RepID=UPI00275A8498|nr:hypothetical protein [Pseudomonas protegens]MDP9503790.1 hypothetical protein [Pseudomonas protegens]
MKISPASRGDFYVSLRRNHQPILADLDSNFLINLKPCLLQPVPMQSKPGNKAVLWIFDITQQRIRKKLNS